MNVNMSLEISSYDTMNKIMKLTNNQDWITAKEIMSKTSSRGLFY